MASWNESKIQGSNKKGNVVYSDSTSNDLLWVDSIMV